VDRLSGVFEQCGRYVAGITGGWSHIRTTLRYLLLLPLPFALVVTAFMLRLEVGEGWGLQALLVACPAVAAAIGGVLYTLAAGAVTAAALVFFVMDTQPGTEAHRGSVSSLVAAAGVTAAGLLASWIRERRERELAEVRLVAESAQRVVLRPVPRRVGPVGLAVRYLSASSGARIGGDLYEVAATPDCLRLIVGDAEGKGLPGVQMAAAALGVFREAAFEEDCLAGVVRRMEASLSRQLAEEQFVTAILAEIRAGTGKMEIISCGHPPPLLLGGSRPQLAAGPETGSLPLGFGSLAGAPRTSLVLPFAPGDGVLFYTDGVTEARNRAGDFFPLAESASVTSPGDPATLVARLADEVARYVGHAPNDDLALLLAYRDRD
jgi:serine phosphatase RsbU (regulator of sigma subunit)